MVYSFELIKHANIRYREYLPVLARCELFVMLFSLDISCEIRTESFGGSTFLTFECRELSDQELIFLFRHSTVVFMAENHDGLLRPLSVASGAFFGDDLPEVLKYKGKTSVSFTRMMINITSAFFACRQKAAPLTFLDPVCGKGTGCFCAVADGMNAVGIDMDHKDIREASDYFVRYLKFHRIKHEQKSHSETFCNHVVPVTEFRYSDSKEHYQAGNVRTLSFSCADTADSPALFRKRKAHILAADLPYGIQHAPHSETGTEPLRIFLRRVLPAWKQCLSNGGTLALSFNTLTLDSHDVRKALMEVGFKLPQNELFTHLQHEVEHAVVRDVVFAFNTQEESEI